MGDDLQRQINRLGGDVAEIRDEVAEIKTGVIEHRVRLENGTKVFATHDDRLKTVEERTTPRPTSLLKIVAVTFAVFVALAGSLWALAHMLRDRPTTDQLREVLQLHEDIHEARGHKAMRGNVASIQQEQWAQRSLLEAVQGAQKAQSSKIDQILDRLPRSLSRGRPRR